MARKQIFKCYSTDTSEVLHSRTLQDIGCLVFCGICASVLLRMSLSVTAVIPRPNVSSVNSFSSPFLYFNSWNGSTNTSSLKRVTLSGGASPYSPFQGVPEYFFKWYKLSLLACRAEKWTGWQSSKTVDFSSSIGSLFACRVLFWRVTPGLITEAFVQVWISRN